jgi:transcriptional regulator with XRE-family HTH domain
MHDSLGQRLARLRSQHGWTQQALADRLALSRVAISHFELGLAVPSERTIILLAGIFRCEPHELVADTFYPSGKALRLPPIAPRYTEAELQLALFERDLGWLKRQPATLAQLRGEWLPRLARLHDASADERERAALAAAILKLSRAKG